VSVSDPADGPADDPAARARNDPNAGTQNAGKQDAGTQNVSDSPTKPPGQAASEAARSAIRRKGPGAVVVPVHPPVDPEDQSEPASRPDWPSLTPVTDPTEAGVEPQGPTEPATAEARVRPSAAGRAADGEPRVQPRPAGDRTGAASDPGPQLVSKPTATRSTAETAARHAGADPIDPMLGASTEPTGDAAHLAQSLRAAQRLYHESRRRFHDFVLSASDWVWETDEHGAIGFISDRITEVIGRPSRTLIGAYLIELGSDVVMGRSLSEALAARRPFRNLAIEIIDVEDKHRFCRLSGIPAFDQDSGRFIGFRGAGSDCTAQFEAEAMARRSQAKLERLVHEVRTKNDRLQEALSDARAAIRAKSEFLANVSHELRTPLNAIIGFTEIMDGEMYGPLGHERYGEYTTSVLQSGRHLLSIINDLLDMAKVESGRLQLKERTLDVAEVAEMCLSLMRDRIKQQGLDLNVRFPSTGPLLWADERLIKQMLINLLGNAVKFTPEGGTLAVEGRTSPEGGYALSVSDTGIGIAPEHLETVLEPFGQVESAMNRSHAGTGLGLPLVNAMIELHGGSMTIDSAPDTGTTVTLRFPPERVLDPPANA
jgi:signal transduction histidine kinase